MQASETYILEDGDGDPAFMHLRHEVRLAEEPWFSTRIMGSPALLFSIVGGLHGGKYLAVISRVLQPIEEQMAARGFASVVVRPITNPTETFDAKSDLGIGGMTVLRRQLDARF